jgi:hypothetical protein
MSEKGASIPAIDGVNEPMGLDQSPLVDGKPIASKPTEFESSISESLQTQIREEVEKRFQSAKDKRWDRLEKQVKQMQALNNTTPEVSGDEGKSFDTKAADLLTKIGLTEDIEANAILHQYLEKGEEAKLLPFVEDVLQLVLQSTRPTSATPASITQPGGAQAPSLSLEAMYGQAKSQLKPGDLLGLLSIKRAFRQKGLDIF